MFIVITPDMHPNRTYTCKPASRTNYGLTRFKVKASKIWETIPKEIKSLPFFTFKKHKFLLPNSQLVI
jgi:hypothetical protein